MTEALQHFKSVLTRKATSGAHWRESCLRQSLIKLIAVVERGNPDDETRAALANCRESIRLVDDDAGLSDGTLHIKKEGR